jgi:hypothetical protein
MRRTHAFHPRLRRRLTWLVMLALLWQQVALAAYACGVAPPEHAATAMSVSKSMGMDDACAQGMAQAPSAKHPLCQAHCQPDRTTQPDVRAGTVPPSLFAALPAVSPSLRMVRITTRAPERLERLRAPPPPVSLLFCSLLI